LQVGIDVLKLMNKHLILHFSPSAEAFMFVYTQEVRLVFT